MTNETAEERSARFEKEHRERKEREAMLAARDDANWVNVQEEHKARMAQTAAYVAEIAHVQKFRDAELEVQKERNSIFREIARALDALSRKQFC